MSTETAYAKINLALHVRRRREDGYHELETLFAFVDAGDVLVAHSAEVDSLLVVGEFSGLLAPLPPSLGGGVGGGGSSLSTVAPPSPTLPHGEGGKLDNIVAKALNALPRAGGLAITLEKNLPVAAGLGGGSADAGAVFRMVRDAYGLPDDWRERAAKLGADVPACVDSDMHIGTGVGDERREIENDLKGMAVLLVNPRVPLPTGPVFKAWDGKDRGPLPDGPASRIARAGRNDLRAPAISLCPVIADVLAALEATGPWMAEMSGSGATCFALFEHNEQRDQAAEILLGNHPDWWQMKGNLL
ncbi:4-(cytidine 5'-diphospho)-2-C-methyl-D-erythritol kinase [Erythrobacter sp. EC-HK427]|uniref:4-(cytidine 5'-diphospho)-2-C-methyl-D-erythritol kinase n=1 Tax=Erythrobacter sp. EC-HK427 TaxID=2038396 RepID=UPI001253413A|nr:4-(cytidine 5'-diphospho)-2-C-methyl-D-erythritol kinase [Erythrobacter sp. EC-HK427]VVT16030.1 4-diphosphocytidyl-2-C-methyl-D-erythritol kinase [Erythrobacter sp. EC-HK427]